MGFDSEESLKVRAGKASGAEAFRPLSKIGDWTSCPRSLADLLERGDSYKAGPPSCQCFVPVCIALLRCGCFGHAFSHRNIS
jgi:hypothetical protein